MKYKVTIHDCPFGWVKEEETKDRARLFELKQQAHENARRAVKELGKEQARNRHFVYYFEMDERKDRKRTGNVLVDVYLAPHNVSDEQFEIFLEESKPVTVGAIHGDNLCSKFFEK